MSILEARELTVDFAQRRGPKFRAVDHVSFALEAGQTLALVGESGSGKSTIARTLARLVPHSDGQLSLRGKPVGRHGRSLRDYRREVQMVLQDPFASLNPAFNIEHHLRRPLRIFGHGREGIGREIEALLGSVNLLPAAQFVAKYPHELSGGQRQRVAIARALATQPSVILADEPVSMLDVSIRLEILNLLDGLKRDRNLALLYITHDLATARHFSDRIMVMYRGQIVEQGLADEVILRPAHPYTKLLEASVPGQRPVTGPGALGRPQPALRPGLTAETTEASAGGGCPFRPRCPHAMDICAKPPPETRIATDHVARCWLHVPSTPGQPDIRQLAGG